MAYLSFTVRGRLSYGNYITVDGSDPYHEIHDAAIFRISPGQHEIIIHSKNGEAWSCDGDVRSDGAFHVRLYTDDQGNVVDMEYAVTRLNSQQEFAYGMTAKKLALTYTRASATAKTSYEADDTDDLDDQEASVLPSEPYSDNPGTDTTYAKPATKKGGTGWIVAGVIFLLAGLANASELSALIGCCAIGAVLLLIGIKKKKK